MLSHRHLNHLSRYAASLMQDLVRHVQCGGDLDVELAYALAELERRKAGLAQIPPDELSGASIDWEGAGLVMSEALGLALTKFAETKSSKAAAAVFSRRVCTIMRPKLWR